MGYLTNAAIVLGAVAAMEGAACAAHKYIMHRWGWGWHRSHHENRPGRLEKNDLYAVVFAAPALALVAVDSPERGPLYWTGIGMGLYGFLYALVHDGIVHRRWPVRVRVRNRYLRRLVQAHLLHHATRRQDGCVSFGFLYAPPVALLRDRLKMARPAEGGFSDASSGS